MFIDHSGSSSRADRCAIASTVYDTAWVAALRHPQNPTIPRVPTAYHWLCNRQLHDGSWGSSVPFAQDRIICTLAAIRALTRFPQTDATYSALRSGQRYLWHAAAHLGKEPVELVAFELLVPTLAADVETAGIELPPYIHQYDHLRREKLALIPPHLQISALTTLSHSLECLGTTIAPATLRAAQNANGSIGNSPAATAYYLDREENAAAWGYLQTCMAAGDGVAVPVLHPCATYDLLWSAYHRALGGRSWSSLVSPQQTAWLAEQIQDGVRLDPSFPIPDADDTAVAALLLLEQGFAIDETVLEQFARPTHYASFSFERGVSTGVNIHALHFLTRLPPTQQRLNRIRTMLTFLGDQRSHTTYWFDKWHCSPFYATAHALISLAHVTDANNAARAAALAAPALVWLRATQGQDGGWGWYGRSTAEETALAVLGLRAWLDREPWALQAARRGRRFIATSRHAPIDALWMDKCLYTPSNIVSAMLNSALDGDLLHMDMTHAATSAVEREELSDVAH